MTITFNINYRTRWGESLVVELLSPYSGQIAMKLVGGNEAWCATTRIADDDITAESPVKYRYLVKEGDKVVRSEWMAAHTLDMAGGKNLTVAVHDRWQDMPYDKPYYSQAFTECFNRRESDPNSKPTLKSGWLLLEAAVPMVAPDEVVLLAGSCDTLGNWDLTKAPEMNSSAFPLWQVELPLKGLPLDIEYKLVVIKKATREVVRWEDGNNRQLSTRSFSPRQAVVVSGLRFQSHRLDWKGAGVAIPVFSLRSKEDCGVGDFYDMKLMVDWAAKTGQRFIQILPINDTTMTGTWTDSYPYNANSTFALHPMYLRPDAIGELVDADRRAYYCQEAEKLNQLAEIDYEAANKLKLAWTHELYEQLGQEQLASEEFSDFYAANGEWLRPYAAFCVLRDIYRTPQFERWENYATYDPGKIDSFIEEHGREIGFVYFQQFNLDRQLKHVMEYAHRHGVAVKGDVPIGISRTSVDAWLNPRLFNLDCQAGAPPDDFSVLGQNWGFPTYNWEEMARDEFSWWKARFRKMADYCDAYRIDHVLGFFRIWEIPMDAIHGLLGVFNPALPMTPEEMVKGYDFQFDRDQYTKPFIRDYVIDATLGELAQEAKAMFLDDLGWGHYALKNEWNTQRKIADYFASQPKDEKSNRLCNGLMALLDDVLFIEDPRQQGKYHPRISGQSTWIYKSLNDYQRWCYDRLYNDFYYHRHDDFWYHKAMWKLPPLIDATGMLTCAEDLGMIPHCVPAVMDQLEILSLEIQRMPKDPNCRWGNPADYPYYSVCTTSTHDMGGIRQWWEENRDQLADFYHNMLNGHGDVPYYAEPWVCEKIIDMHLDSPSMLCILPLQDWLSMDGSLRRTDPREEQINVPANSRHYWRYRMHLTLEELLACDKFNTTMLDHIKRSGR